MFTLLLLSLLLAVLAENSSEWILDDGVVASQEVKKARFD